MSFFTLLFTIFNYVWWYLKGFTHEEILAKRCDIIQTVIFTTLILFGFQPLFKLLLNGLNFFYELVLKLFFPKKFQQQLNLKTTKVENQNALLKMKLAANAAKLKKLQSQKDYLTQKLKKLTTNNEEEEPRLTGKEDYDV
ncbi:MAG: hypothetical protein ACLTFB_02585 [Candidatus Phytoplasma pyri]|uniref:hypothetical protein n=1 Tax=Candidatus Phytoplasma pyri TaxID=47566 RepID=UPI003983C2AD